MKRLTALLALMLLISLTGCCYAPGTEGMYGLDSWYMNVPTFPDSGWNEEGETPTEGMGESMPVEDDMTIPDPEVDLDALPPRESSDFVKVTDYIPDIVVDLKYATEDNFTGQVIYEFTEPYLRYGTVKKLMAVQEGLKAQGLGLKIWDGFRPVSAQEKLWHVCPDPTYVSPPGTGTQSHCRGIAVDITLVDASGAELTMPTGFDDFSELADRDYSDCTAEAAKNARLLEKIMEENGFKPYFGEWWHYADTVSYDVEQEFYPTED